MRLLEEQNFQIYLKEQNYHIKISKMLIYQDRN